MIGPRIAKWLGGQVTVIAALFAFMIPFAILAVTSNPYVAALALFLETFAGMTWNVVTVSLRQRLIPDALLGRVNSIYRFFGWGTIPLGALAAGALVSLFEADLGREAALRLPYIVGLVGSLILAIYGTFRLRLPT
jgi:hypothetical protein